jgi:hypothetical protein
MIFDEIDRGVGGAVASAVGERLHRLAEAGQVLVVTHSPQVAARGARHLLIEKSHDGLVTRTSVQALGCARRRRRSQGCCRRADHRGSAGAGDKAAGGGVDQFTKFNDPRRRTGVARPRRSPATTRLYHTDDAPEISGCRL